MGLALVLLFGVFSACGVLGMNIEELPQRSSIKRQISTTTQDETPVLVRDGEPEQAEQQPEAGDILPKKRPRLSSSSSSTVPRGPNQHGKHQKSNNDVLDDKEKEKFSCISRKRRKIGVNKCAGKNGTFEEEVDRDMEGHDDGDDHDEVDRDVEGHDDGDDHDEVDRDVEGHDDGDAHDDDKTDVEEDQEDASHQGSKKQQHADDQAGTSSTIMSARGFLEHLGGSQNRLWDFFGHAELPTIRSVAPWATKHVASPQERIQKTRKKYCPGPPDDRDDQHQEGTNAAPRARTRFRNEKELHRALKLWHHNMPSHLGNSVSVDDDVRSYYHRDRLSSIHEEQKLVMEACADGAPPEAWDLHQIYPEDPLFGETLQKTARMMWIETWAHTDDVTNLHRRVWDELSRLGHSPSIWGDEDEDLVDPAATASAVLEARRQTEAET
ncbi:unnamed protein product, partial [Amoebophrya sp. A25]|eukprot:GSA25T00003378001.1